MRGRSCISCQATPHTTRESRRLIPSPSPRAIVTPPRDPDSPLPLARGARLTHLAEQLGIDRRRFLAASGGTLGALFLAACDAMGPDSAKGLLKFAEQKNEVLERALFRHTSI